MIGAAAAGLADIGKTERHGAPLGRSVYVVAGVGGPAPDSIVTFRSLTRSQVSPEAMNRYRTLDRPEPSRRSMWGGDRLLRAWEPSGVPARPTTACPCRSACRKRGSTRRKPSEGSQTRKTESPPQVRTGGKPGSSVSRDHQQYRETERDQTRQGSRGAPTASTRYTRAQRPASVADRTQPAAHAASPIHITRTIAPRITPATRCRTGPCAKLRCRGVRTGR